VALAKECKIDPRGKNYPYYERTDREIELALAWLKGDVNTKQCAYAMDVEMSAVKSWLNSTLSTAYRKGLLVEKGR